jgi:thiamine pyrophosphate-dependent acetolactate synthase large subunit-like protein
MLLVHPDGLGSGGTIHAARVAKASELEETLREAIKVVLGGTTAVVEVALSV